MTTLVQFEIQEAKPSDMERLTRFMLAFGHELFCPEVPPSEKEEIRARFVKTFGKEQLPISRDWHWLMAMDHEHGEIIGCVSLSYMAFPRPTDDPQREIGDVSSCLVHPDYRRRGVHRDLLEHAIGIARREKLTKLRHAILDTESVGRTLLEHYGFTPGQKFKGDRIPYTFEL